VEAFVTAYNVDSLAAFGCVIGLNRPVDMATAEQIGSHFVDCVIAPDYEPEALEHLRKKKNIRLLRTNAPIGIDAAPEHKMKKVKGGILVQTNRYVDVTRCSRLLRSGPPRRRRSPPCSSPGRYASMCGPTPSSWPRGSGW
jgi:phosphoribosylaminoimidazolecarboxamide formyltransferase/IMP cyclohydrolase